MALSGITVTEADRVEVGEDRDDEQQLAETQHQREEAAASDELDVLNTVTNPPNRRRYAGDSKNPSTTIETTMRQNASTEKTNTPVESAVTLMYV